MEKMRFVDIFAGIGGMRLGVLAADHSAQCVFSSEIDRDAVHVYYDNFRDVPAGDITEIDPSSIPDHDLLCAGFPCQPFSTAGGRLGTRDPRGRLIYTIIRLIEAKRPRGFLLENVPGFISDNGGQTFTESTCALRKIGYEVQHIIIDASDFGLPQKRRRLFILGSMGHLDIIQTPGKLESRCADILQNGLPCDCANQLLLRSLEAYGISGLRGKNISDKRGGKNNIHSWDLGLRGKTTPAQNALLCGIMLERRKRKHNTAKTDGVPLSIDVISEMAGRHVSDDIADLTEKGYLRQRNGGYDINCGKLSFEFTHILDPTGMAPTLTATDTSRIGVIDANGVRHLSVLECKRLMGIPDDYRFGKLPRARIYKLIGNSVCVNCVKFCSREIINSWKT